MNDFIQSKFQKDVQDKIIGKTIKSIDSYYQCDEDFIDIKFTDGFHLRLRYDWIYEWEIVHDDMAVKE